MKGNAITVEIVDGLGHVSFTQGQRGNPIDGQFCRELNEASIILTENRDVRAVLFTAEGAAFSYGGDIASFLPNIDVLPAMIKRWTADLHMGIARLQRMDAPMIAAVHGICAGGMAGFVAGCDIVISAQDARFVAAYTGIGYCCDAGSSVSLSQRMGSVKAKKFLLLNETLDAESALSVGLVDEVCPGAELTERAQKLSQRLANGPTQAFGEIRRLMASAGRQPLETQLEDEAQALARCASSEDAREGLTAFANKKQPAFRGK